MENGELENIINNKESYLTNSLKKMLQYMIPIYGDYKIHKSFTKKRKELNEKNESIPIEMLFLEEREHKFHEELSDLLEKYNIRAQTGSLFSFEQYYEARERTIQANKKFNCSPFLETTLYVEKYMFLYLTYNVLLF
jgi:hypothetical protein